MEIFSISETNMTKIVALYISKATNIFIQHRQQMTNIVALYLSKVTKRVTYCHKQM